MQLKVSDRLAIADRIGRELQDRYSYSEIDTYLDAFGVPRPQGITANSKWVYAKSALGGVSASTLGEIVEDLGIEALATISAKTHPPEIWKDSRLRVFISHLSSEKLKATRLRDALNAYGASAFVAHEDIEPTLEWQVQIERALHCMELFISIHTPGFSKSIWTQQEIGFASCRGVKIIALRMGEDPTGFISKHQALSRGVKTAEQIAADIDVLLRKDERIKDRYEQCVLDADVPF
jgi:signal recognition particle subunit SEC65